MSYKIRYNQHGYGYRFTPKLLHINRRNLVYLLCAIAIVASVYALHFDSVRRCFLPGNPEVTEAALTGFVEDLKNGESVDTAVVAFCQEIIDNGDVS